MQCPATHRPAFFSGVMLLATAFIFTALVGPVGGQERPDAPGQETTEQEKATAKARELLRLRRNAKPKEEELDVLKIRIPIFRVENAPLIHAVLALNAVGVDVCYEASANSLFLDWADQDGVEPFRADKLISMDLANATVQEIMDGIVKADPRYTWQRLPETNLLNLVPEAGRLDFKVGPINASDNPIMILIDVGKNPKWSALLPPVVRGGHYPRVSLNLEPCSARAFLNAMVRQHKGLTWYCLPIGTNLSYFSDDRDRAMQVQLKYPKLDAGKGTNFSFAYEIDYRKTVDGVPTVVAERKPVAKRKSVAERNPVQP